MEFTKKDLPKKSDNLSEWYNKVVIFAELADYGPAKGTMIFRPYGYAIWELIQQEMNRRMKEKGVENAYFPLFIPETLLKKEKDHVKGFSPELAVVTIGGGEELKERLVVRPTSETIMYDAYARWIHSWRDLPFLINQWNNVVRWEKRTYLFLRTTEFLWQEGHTAHATHREAEEMMRWAMDMYASVYRELFALPGFVGKKSESEKFAGADTTLTYETLMPEGKILQSATSHDLGQNFSRPFNISFQNKEGVSEYVWQTSWGLSTRSIGGLLMAHGDDAGLMLPPRLAPVQMVILPVRLEDEILNFANSVRGSLEQEGIRVFLDARENETFGFKINKWELKGAPVRIEVGEKEMREKFVTLVRRDTGERRTVKMEALCGTAAETLSAIQENLYDRALQFLRENTREVDTFEDFENLMQNRKGFLHAYWCENSACEEAIKEKTKASTRCLPLDADAGNGSCVYCGKQALYRWLFGQAY